MTLDERAVLAECYGMFTILRRQQSPGVRRLMEDKMHKIESVMGATGREWRARRLAEEREVAA